LYCGNEPIASAPIKFRTLGNILNGSYNVAAGETTFYVENMRVNCQFALINGGAQYPMVVGQSNSVSFSSPAIPLGVRVALVDNAVGKQVAKSTSVRVSWNSLGGGRPALRWWTDAKAPPTDDQLVPAVTGMLAAVDMCSEPASGSGYINPGVWRSLGWSAQLFYYPRVMMLDCTH
jgi:hypothetical protein